MKNLSSVSVVIAPEFETLAIKCCTNLTSINIKARMVHTSEGKVSCVTAMLKQFNKKLNKLKYITVHLIIGEQITLIGELRE